MLKKIREKKKTSCWAKVSPSPTGHGFCGIQTTTGEQKRQGWYIYALLIKS